MGILYEVERHGGARVYRVSFASYKGQLEWATMWAPVRTARGLDGILDGITIGVGELAEFYIGSYVRVDGGGDLDGTYEIGYDADSDELFLHKEEVAGG